MQKLPEAGLGLIGIDLPDHGRDVYSHIIDEDRRKNAELFEEAFYKRKNLNPNVYGIHSQELAPPKVIVPENIDPVLLQKVLSNPEMAALVNALARSMEKPENTTNPRSQENAEYVEAAFTVRIHSE